MGLLADILAGVVAILHIYFLVLEMFFWDKPLGIKTFNLEQNFAVASRTLAMNQGLYNGFLAAGLIWGIYLGDQGNAIVLFFLGFIILAGVYGAITANRKIFFVQALPAIVAVLARLI